MQCCSHLVLSHELLLPPSSILKLIDRLASRSLPRSRWSCIIFINLFAVYSVIECIESFQILQKWKMWTASPTEEQPWGQVQWFWKERLGFPFSSLCGARTHARLCALVKSLFSVIVWSWSSGSKSVFLAKSHVDCQLQTPHLLILGDGFGIIAAVAQNLHQEIGQVG